MFTGIVMAVGKLEEIDDRGGDRSMVIRPGGMDMSDVGAGDSISINGVCLTVTGLKDDGFRIDISAETLSCTTFGSLRWGDMVNLEKALRAGDRLGGHMVSGHIDGVGRIVSLENEARSVRCEIEVPGELLRYICRKGSICVDGVSLTVNDVSGSTFGVNIIPHTMQETVFSTYGRNSKVNIEVDIIARYLERLVQSGSNF